MTRPPLYVRRPVLAGLLRQLPLLAVLVTVAVALAVVAVGHWRQGLVMIGVVLLASALLRLLLPVRRVGFLAVRSRLTDVVIMATAGALLIVLVLMIPYSAA
jgi:hypothetical protein